MAENLMLFDESKSNAVIQGSVCSDADERLITTKEVAEQLGTDKKVILENARKYLPSKRFEHGKTALWSKAELTVLIDGMKQNQSNQYREKGTVTAAVTVASTDLTPALKIKKAMELMQEGYEEELAILRAKNAEKDRQLEEQKPMVESYKDYVDRGKFCNFRDGAKYLGLKEKEFMTLLKSKYIYKNSVGEYRTAAHADNGRTDLLRKLCKENGIRSLRWRKHIFLRWLNTVSLVRARRKMLICVHFGILPKSGSNAAGRRR